MINPNTIPNIIPGQLLNTLTTNDDYSVRYHVQNEPAHFVVFNRPLTDLEYRNLILARSIDQLQAAYGSAANYPFLNVPYITNGTTSVPLPTGLLWDMTLSVPEGWENIRLFGIQRVSGSNVGTGEYEGTIRLLFSASPQGSTDEFIVRSFDLDIDTILSYTITPGSEVSSSNVGVVLPTIDRPKFVGYASLISPDLTSQQWIDFLEFVGPPNDDTIGSDGEYVNPSTYEVVDSIAGSTAGTNDFNESSISHGTGILAQSVISYIPGRTVQGEAVLGSINYPFSFNAVRTNADAVEIPNGMFYELQIIAPDNDGSANEYPVWISKLKKTATDTFEVIFSTYPIVGVNQPSIEFSKVTVNISMTSNTLIPLTSTNNLYGTSDTQFGQNFGAGHVVLGDMWSSGDGRKSILFNKMNVFNSPNDSTTYTIAQTRLSSLAVSRVPSYSPTLGQAGALRGSSARKQVPVHPGIDNRYVTEKDYGIKSQIDLNAVSGITANNAIERYGYLCGSAPRNFTLCIDRSLVSDDADDYYTTHILPRIRSILNDPEAPAVFDRWYDGTRFLTYNGNAWIAS